MVSGSSGSSGGGGTEGFDSVVTETKIHRATWSLVTVREGFPTKKAVLLDFVQITKVSVLGT